jgi:hypothetical protein
MKAINWILRNDANLTALLTGGANAIYLGHAKQGQKAPYLSVELTTDDTYISKELASTLAKETYSIAVYATDYGTMESVSEKVVAALDNKTPGTYNGQAVTSCMLTSRDRMSGVDANNDYYLSLINFDAVVDNTIVLDAGTSVAAIRLTQVEYDAIVTPQPNTYYIIEN